MPRKRTKEDLARSIEMDGVLDDYYSSCRYKYYKAFGQLWKIVYTRNGTVKSVEQLRNNFERISL